MSLSRSVYVGPYLRCRVEQIEASRDVRACHNPKCKSYQRERYDKAARFCGDCGGAITEQSVVDMEDRVNKGELTETIREALHYATMPEGNLVCWLPNVDRGPPRRFGIEHEDGCHSLTTSDIAAETAWFERAFAPEIATIRTAYGDECCGVIWGIVAYTM